MRLIPPKMISDSNITRKIVTAHFGMLKALCNEVAIALDCTPGIKSPIEIIVTIANINANIFPNFPPIPFSM